MKLTSLAWFVLCLLVDLEHAILELYRLPSWRDQEPWVKAAHVFGQLASKTKRRWGLKDAEAIKGL